MIRAALALVGHGFAVFPCLPKMKIPATPHGFKDASKDVAVATKWWTDNPRFNIAIATGQVSNVFVLDLDGDEGFAELGRLEAQFGELPNTLTACTANGMHYYYCWPGRAVPCSAGKVSPGIDIRGDGGYCLAPPSLHPSGKRYAWSVDSANAIATAPDWLLERAISHNGNGKGAVPASEWREICGNGVPEGKRNCTTARLAGHLLSRSVDPIVTLELLQAWNAVRCSPPLPPEDVGRIVDSIAGRELRRRGGG
jgi:hypothetical protein